MFEPVKISDSTENGIRKTAFLTCPEVNHPKLVRYAWEPYTRANLYNGAGLPASTFRVEVY